MNYTDDEMIRMLTNECPVYFGQAIEYLKQQLIAKIYYYIIKNGGAKEDVEEVFNDAILVANHYAINKKFRAETNVSGFVSEVAKNIFRRRIRKEKVLPVISVDHMVYDLSNMRADLMENEALELRIQVVLKVLDQLNAEENAILFDYYWEGLSMSAIAEKYNFKNAQNARNKKSKILKKLRSLL